MKQPPKQSLSYEDYYDYDYPLYPDEKELTHNASTTTTELPSFFQDGNPAAMPTWFETGNPALSTSTTTPRPSDYYYYDYYDTIDLSKQQNWKSYKGSQPNR